MGPINFTNLQTREVVWIEAFNKTKAHLFLEPPKMDSVNWPLSRSDLFQSSVCVHVCLLGIGWILCDPFLFSSHKDSSQMDQTTGCFSSRPDMCSVDLTPSQAAPLLLCSSETREEQSKHTSVIQAPGVSGSTKAFPLPPQPYREALSKPLCLTLSPKPSSLSSSPKPLSVSLSPKHCSVSESPKPLSYARKPTSLSSSPNTSINSSPKPSSLMKARSSPDESLLHISDFNQHKQVTVYLFLTALHSYPSLFDISRTELQFRISIHHHNESEHEKWYWDKLQYLL